MALLFRPRAEADLSDIWDYTVETWGAPQAAAYLQALDQMLQTIATFPDMARLRAEFDPPVRVHQFQKHLIIYQKAGADIDVIRILHSRSNWADYLAE